MRKPIRFANNQSNAKHLVAWFRKNDPKFYAFAKKSGALGDLDAAAVTAAPKTSATSALAKGASSIFDSLTKAATAYYGYKGQKDIAKLQIKRAEQGLAPLDTQYLQPGVQLQHSFDVAQSFGMSKNTMLLGAAGVLALILITMRSKRR